MTSVNRSVTTMDLREIARTLRARLSIRQILEQEKGVVFRQVGRDLVALCPFHPDSRPSFHVRVSNDGVERFYCYGCAAGRSRTNHDSGPGSWGDVFDLMQLLDNYADYLTTLRALAERHGIAWPLRANGEVNVSTKVLDTATRYYAEEMTGAPLAYLASRGFPEAFVRKQRIGFAPRDPGFGFTRLAEAQGFDRTAESIGLIQKATDTRPRRDYFLNRIIFPNIERGHTVDLQGRAFPADREPKYLNLPGARRRLYHADACAHRDALLCEGVPDTDSSTLAEVPASGLYGTGGWSRELQPLFRRCRRVYVAFDRDATERAIAVAKDFGLRGRVLIPPVELGPKGDMNQWLVGPAKSDPKRFKELLLCAMATSPGPWALAIERLGDVPPWERSEQIADLLREIGAMPPVDREIHLDLLHRKTGVSFAALAESAQHLSNELEGAAEV